MPVRIATTGFDPFAEAAAFAAGRTDMGALVHFVGYCRDATAGRPVDALHLEHYAGFTEQEIARFSGEICSRFGISDALIIHRVGTLRPGEPIVLVAVLAVHRAAAFEACGLVMDYLKTDAPLWKKEIGPDGTCWIEPGTADLAHRAAADRSYA
jgi:molybdopterin synthase catalytic subunit